MATNVAIQDDSRETELRELFKLKKPPESGRSGMDAVLDYKGSEYPFELKSTTTGSVTTVRDFGYDHIQKWKDKHWLIGVYDNDGITLLYSLYGSPQMIAPWIAEKEDYIRTDFQLSEIIPDKVSIEDMYRIIGKKRAYTLEDAKKLHKRQYSQDQFLKAMDMKEGYSPNRMKEILADRCRYLIERGSTLNNPHIPKSYFEGWEQITKNHSKRLREMVEEAIAL